MRGYAARFLPVGALALFLVLVALLAQASLSASASPLAQPKTPHPVEGRGNCLLCHSSGGPRPAPANHVAFTNDLCLNCHPVALAPPATSTPPPMPTPGATVTPSQATPTPAPSPTGIPVGTVTPFVPTPTSQPPATPTPSPSPTPYLPSIEVDACLACHGTSGLKLFLPSGEYLSLSLDGKNYAQSVHGDKLNCTDCHSKITDYPHPKREIASVRQNSLALYEVCKRCHFANYTKTLDSVHFSIMSQGHPEAPVCTDCHGSHYVSPPDKPRSKVSQTCARCHQGIYDAYSQSIHGKALLSEANGDVPVCTTCHGVHNIQDPRTPSFRLETPDLCAQCHSDAKLMAKYGISANVVKNYVQDFHGVTVTLYRRQNADISSLKPVCTDCHGVHDISRTDDPNSPVMKANLVNTCRKCHPDASENFPSAWLSHYDPSLQKAPMVFSVRVFYLILIPFIVGGLSLHILLDLWRWATNR